MFINFLLNLTFLIRDDMINIYNWRLDQLKFNLNFIPINYFVECSKM